MVGCLVITTDHCGTKYYVYKFKTRYARVRSRAQAQRKPCAGDQLTEGDLVGFSSAQGQGGLAIRAHFP